MRRPLLASALLVLALLTGCSSGTTDAGSTSSPATTADATTPTPTTTAAAAAGCPASGAEPAGSTSAPTLDVDGDGRPDTEWIAAQPAADGSVAFGVRTASGGVFSAELRSASPVARSLLVADVTGDGELVVFADDGRQVLLYAVSDCSLVPVLDARGQQYAFDLGFTGHGTGVGCADVDGDGVRDLAGLLADGSSVTSTVVRLDGPRAANGTSRTTEDAPAAQLEAAHQVTCGDLTLAADGVTSGP
ncbi:hypothetical protein [Modestobacter versicolor]|uniref:hypothetical protein n=1 Tax=Modestobacter versicolor TaxID=429133 RepID=UPI0034DE184D